MTDCLVGRGAEAPLHPRPRTTVPLIPTVKKMSLGVRVALLAVKGEGNGDGQVVEGILAVDRLLCVVCCSESFLAGSGMRRLPGGRSLRREKSK